MFLQTHCTEILLCNGQQLLKQTHQNVGHSTTVDADFFARNIFFAN